MDYDVITANDFGGEAFLPINSVPGVEIGSSSIDNFHGLKPFMLPLMFQKRKSIYRIQRELELFKIFLDHPILSTLEHRSDDKLAQDFLKRQKERIKE